MNVWKWQQLIGVNFFFREGRRTILKSESENERTNAAKERRINLNLVMLRMKKKAVSLEGQFINYVGFYGERGTLQTGKPRAKKLHLSRFFST